ncbi:RNA-binding_protein [Hexamita inflata]|uniref:RNA-binding protein n=1 Tax=Hexamita inflata TaxID=28002 RepID=A0AA86PR71_9EUKA|nr:RNA-binding protein [Hexamita inflata]CAI9950263.1 RNA-binding protein [Hexamita inflata]
MTLIVTDLPENVDEELMYELFLQFRQPKCISFPYDPVTQKHFGKCFVEFYSQQDAVDSMNVFDNVKLYQRQIKIHLQQSSAQFYFKVFTSPNSKSIQNIALCFGTCEVSGNFITFSRREDAEQFIEKVNQQTIDGKTVKAEWAK